MHHGVKWMKKMLHDILNTNNTELIILFTNNNIPKKSLLGNFGYNKMLKSMDVFYEKENDLNKEKIIDFGMIMEKKFY